MEILFLLIVLVVLFLAVFSSRKEQTSFADEQKDAVQKEKEGFDNELDDKQEEFKIEEDIDPEKPF